MTTRGRGLNTIADVRGRCVVDEISKCWRWDGAFAVNTVKGSRCPVAHFPPTGRTTSVLRIALLLTGKRPGAVTWRTCCSDSCVNPAHLLTGTRSQWGEWCEARGNLRGQVARRAANRRAKITNGAKLTPELAAWARESSQKGADIAHALAISPTSVSRAKLGRTWAPLASPFAGLSTIMQTRHRPGPGARARAANGPMREAA